MLAVAIYLVFSLTSYHAATVPVVAGLVPKNSYSYLPPYLPEYQPVYIPIVAEYPDLNAARSLAAYLHVIGAKDSELRLLMRIAHKESTYNPTAKNPTSAAYGIFQYMPITWQYQCSDIGDWRDWSAQASCALRDLRKGRLSQWVVTKNF